MDCPKCGQDNPATARFCVKCGVQVPPPPPPVEATGRCSACGTENALTTKFCVKCGKALQGKDESPKSKACPGCGVEAASETNFCGECGTPLSGEQVTAQSPPSPGGLGGLVLQAMTPKCPQCGARQPTFRTPKDAREFLLGVWTCRECGCQFTATRKRR